MGLGGRFCFCCRFCLWLLLAFVVVTSARNTLLLSEDEGWSIVGRSLKVSLDDYGEPTANRGHDPSRNRGGSGNAGGGRKG